MRALLALGLALPGLALAQSSVKLVFDRETPRQAWVAQSPNEPPPLDLPEITLTAVSLDTDSPNSFLCVLDKTAGNMASKPAKGLSTWKVQTGDYTRIGKITVRLDQGGSPPDYASISVGGVARMIDPSSKGRAEFFGVPAGKVKIDVAYRSGGKDVTKSQVFEVELTRTEAVPVLMVALPEGAVDEEGTKPAPKETAAPQGSVIGNLLLVLLVAAGAIALLLFGLKWIYANPDKTKDTLGKLGVQVPDPGVDPADDSAQPPPIVAPPPTSQIMLPDAGVATSPAATSVQSVPRLVGAAGSFELTDGVHVIGREAGLTIALIGESTLSRRHAEIVRQGDTMTIRDLGSTNGTYVNGSKVQEQELRRGDTVQLGSVQFRVE